MWENAYSEKIRARRIKFGEAEEQPRLQTWESNKLKNKTVSRKWEDGFVLEDVSQVTGFASHRKCILAYICKISVALGQSTLLVADLFVEILQHFQQQLLNLEIFDHAASLWAVLQLDLLDTLTIYLNDYEKTGTVLNV